MFKELFLFLHYPKVFMHVLAVFAELSSLQRVYLECFKW